MPPIKPPISIFNSKLASQGGVQNRNPECKSPFKQPAITPSHKVSEGIDSLSKEK